MRCTDNLLALKALLPYYAGQVKCIYIDPPYNTGDESWEYNDAVNSPEMRDWLGKAVGGEAEDLSRHDKWLCMIYPTLMSNDGRYLVVEYKNVIDWSNDENKEKRDLVELWEARSGGACLFVMPKGRDFAAIRAKAS